MSICRFGIIGAGNIARHFCDAVRRVEGAQVLAVASKDPARARAFAAEQGIAGAYDSYEALLRDPQINIVYIATTHNFHMENIRACLEHGKHVLCEKAMVLNADDAREAFRLAREKGLFLMEAMWTRFLPAVVKARNWLAQGCIGQLQAASAVVGFRGSQDPGNRILNPALAGGAMYDIGVYAIEVLSFVVGEPVEDVLSVWRPHAVTGVDERVTMILRYPSCDAAVQCLVSSPAKESILLQGSDGVIELPFVTGGFDARVYNDRKELVENFHEPWENGFVFEIQEVVRCISAGETFSPVIPPEDTVACAEIFEKVLGG